MPQLCLPDKKYIASLDVDAQNAFTSLCPDELPVPDGNLIAEELNRQACFAHIRVGSKDAHPLNGLWEVSSEHPMLSPVDAKNVDVHWPRHAIAGTFGSQLIEGLPKPEQYDYFVWKGVEPDLHPYGCCFHDLEEKLTTGVIEFLQAKEITTVIVGGLALEHCVRATVMQLSNAGFEVVVNLAATRGLDPESINQALKQMQGQGIKIINSCEQLVVSTK
ncbi:isochorismatase family protein [Parashewanella tropica]|uniref:isochorismatase family protein n=1 Tax=Parashewanella tropica TaxID=2547970 RepID=UPI00105A0968|nr:isochorismatase family protein [Parashewanella tropica]